jgi:transposase
VARIDALFVIEREINGKPSAERQAVRDQRARSLVVDLETWLRVQRGRLSPTSDTTKVINDMLNPWPSFARLPDGRICLSNNTDKRMAL